MTRIDGRVALVTGAARGIGLSYALRLARMGANVAVCDRNLESFADYATEAERISGGSIESTLAAAGVESYAAEVDVTDAEQVARFVEDVHRKWGRIDVAVCNAGGGSGDPSTGAASQIDFGQARSVLDSNLFGTFHTAVPVAQVMKGQGSGKIITVASFIGTTAPRGGAYADYAVAKAAVAHYTRFLAQDLAPAGITVNALAPGLIGTGQWKARFTNDDDAALDQAAGLVPLGRLGSPDDCADVLEFLASDLSNYVTGQILSVDGGMAAWAH